MAHQDDRKSSARPSAEQRSNANANANATSSSQQSQNSQRAQVKSSQVNKAVSASRQKDSAKASALKNSD